MHKAGKQDEIAGTGERAAGLSRRRLIQISTGGAVMAAMGVGKLMGQAPAGGATAPAASGEPLKLKGAIKQGCCKWCLPKNISLDELAQNCVRLGLKGVDLIDVKDWPTLKKYNLICPMANSHGIGKGFNRKENFDECIAKVKKGIDDCAAAGFPNVICFSGNRAGMDDEEGAKNMIEGIKKVAGYAEEKKVTICLEFLNSINHKDYMADHTAWCVKVVKGVGSPRFKILYDIYHAKMMKEDPLKDVNESIECIGHFHTAGCPGRGALVGAKQEIDYPAVMKAIVAKKYDAYVSHEFNCGDKWKQQLEEAIKLCDV